MTEIWCNDVLGMTIEEVKKLSNEELAKLVKVNVTTPNGEDVELYYFPIESNEMDECVYSYPISKSGNYTFKATNSRGRSFEITVPVEIDETKIKTCTIDVYDYDKEISEYKKIETQTIAFIDGQTWEEYIDDLNNRTIDGMKFSVDNYVGIKYSKVSNYFETLFIGEGNDIKEVLPTDKIVENGVYSFEPAFR